MSVDQYDRDISTHTTYFQPFLLTGSDLLRGLNFDVDMA